MHLSRRKIYIGTKNPKPVTSKQVGAFLAEDGLDRIQYIPTVFECDGYGLALAGRAKLWFAEECGINPAFGIVWTAKTSEENAHALNFYVRREYAIIYIEPQTDLQVFPSGKNVFVLI
jgi:hypothetical protein